MRRIQLTLAFVLCFAKAFSQRGNYIADMSQANQFYTDYTGKPVYLKSEYNIEGKPYHPDTYYLATIIMVSGKAYVDVPVKFNLAENFLIYRTAKGEELVATGPVRAVVYTDTTDHAKMQDVIFERGYPPIDKLDALTYYEVLDTGKIKLLKHYLVSYTDARPYNSASISRIYDEKEEFYIYHPEQGMKKIEKGCENILTLMSDKKNEVTQYISQQGLKCKKQADWKKLIAYYNSLM